MPAGLTFEETAMVPQSGTLAIQGLRGFGREIRAGHRVLLNGAFACVGPFVVRIAKARGAHVTRVSSAARVDMVRDLGAGAVLDDARTDVTCGERYDRILDVAGNHSIRDWRRALERDGTCVKVGGPTGRIL
jgi:NADPH:quinone reductase-like Zn-dependent oxidoreductase